MCSGRGWRRRTPRSGSAAARGLARPRAPRARRPAAGGGARGASGPARAPASRCARRAPADGACRRAPPTSTEPSRLLSSACSRLRAVAHRRPQHHQPGHGRGRGVVLGDELLGHLGLVALGAVVEVEAWRSANTPSRPGTPARGHRRPRPRRRSDRRYRSPRRRSAGAASATDSGEPVAVGRRALELLRLGGGGHLPLEVALDLAVKPERKSMIASMLRRYSSRSMYPTHGA